MKIPGRLALAREYGVDLTTIQRAIADLQADGTFRAIGRQGTYVARVVTVATMPGTVDTAATKQGVRQSTIGILSSCGYDYTDTRIQHDGWLPTIIAAAERVISSSGGRTNFLDIFDHLTWQEGAVKLLSEHLDGLLIIDPYNLAFPEITSLSALIAAQTLPAVIITAEEFPCLSPTSSMSSGMQDMLPPSI